MSVAKTRLLRLVLVLLVACPAFTIRVAAQPVWSADGRHLYFEGVVYERDGETGALTAKQRLAAEGAARVLAASPDGTNAYGQEDEHDPVGIHTWRRDPATGLHTLEQEIPDVTVTSIAVSPDGRNLYAGARDEQVLVFDRDQNRGALTPIGSAGVLGRVVYLVFDPGGQHLYVGSVVEGTRPALPRSRLVHFLRDRVTGALSAGDLVELPHPHLAAQNGPRAIMDPDGSIFYDVRSLIRTYVAARDPIDGTLTWLETLSRGVSAMSPDGLHLYGTFGRRIQRMLSQDLLREPEDLALLPPVTRFPPAALSMSPDGRHLYATEARGDAVRVLQRDASSGGLSDLAVAACTVVGTGAVNRNDFVKLENSGLYWHLVDLVWIFIFPLYYLLL